MLERKSNAKKAKSKFFQQYNEIDIYIEDTAVGYKKLFTKLMSRYFKGKYQVENVFPLGGRLEVIKACHDDQVKSDRPRIYIIDGDLYLLTGEKHNLKGLYILPRYCIENHLICSESILKIMEEEDPEKEIETLRKIFDFNGWVNSNKENLLLLYIEYAIAKKIAPHIKTVSHGHKCLINDNTGIVDSEKIQNHIKEVRVSTIQATDIETYEEARSEVSQIVSFSDCDFLSYISGKDVLMPLLLMRLKKNVKTNSTNIAIKHRLSNNCSVDTFKDLNLAVNLV
ncbi:hypothetical protein VIOR3934_15856 [Vibrio orientalis CIP 102891 = ATCC 33934]|uniref:DUF4435 domain-containing protein n=1 Tax=Vibrio orientalis CIP 102891 = ATCC 33934 TaxID=675816 RepID=C9QI72_VIBOR|nr:DUF4435 domain-containing protein [Vibrio orientalis]EEX92511.1 hypothetical protein VIA_003156 [Vibrio orientalis CIP 102891 = ATCC 33934]EGU48013.1 hypothetical protein VIOR3934_15856 [Vibrio orientalis CIP 102891 = ATCC 33934]